MTKVSISRSLQGAPEGGAAGLARRAEPQQAAGEGVERGVGFLARIIRFLFWVMILSWVVWLVQRLVRALGGRPGAVPQPPQASQQERKPLYRDPVCGTHVAREISFPLEHEGQVIHFCSAECRERFRAGQCRAASGQ